MDDIYTEPRPPSYQKRPHKKLFTIVLGITTLFLVVSGFSYYSNHSNSEIVVGTQTYSGKIIRTNEVFTNFSEKIITQGLVVSGASPSGSQQIATNSEKLISSVNRSNPDYKVSYASTTMTR